MTGISKGKRQFMLPFTHQSTLRRYCEQSGVTVLDAQYGDAVTLTLTMKASQAEAFCRGAVDLLRGALQIDDRPR